MPLKLQSAVDRRDNMTLVRLSGVIDEDNEFSALVDKIPRGRVVFDLSEIRRINSVGVRDWIDFLSKISKNGARLELTGCSPAVVAQINLIENFTGGGLVKSIYLPYICPNCDREEAFLVDVAALGSTPHVTPTFRCDKCSGAMEFDDVEERYFAFLHTA